MRTRVRMRDRTGSAGSVRGTDNAFRGSGDEDSLVRLQRAAGNQAVQRLLDGGGGTGGGAGAVAGVRPRGRGAAGRQPSRGHALLGSAVDSRLDMSRPGDGFERQADRAADGLTHDATRERAKPNSGTGKPGRRTSHCTGSGVQSHDEHRHASPRAGNVLSGPGRPIDSATLGFMESRLGGDFGDVRVHTDSRSARALDARAYTVGNRVVFDRGAYAPHSTEGRRLLGHELTHVMQQRGEYGPVARTPALMREVRGQVTREREGRSVEDDEWGVVSAALSDARAMVRQTVPFINGIHNHLFESSDPRLMSDRERSARSMFIAHYKNPRPLDGLLAQDYFGYILSALQGLGRDSFRVVTDRQANADSDGDTYGYVRGRDPAIYLAESFFSELQQMDESTTPGGTASVTVGPRLLSASQKARLLIHETAHFRLGAGHSGGVFGFDVENCAGGLGIRSAQQGLDNAYVYDHFAFCVSCCAP